MSSETAPFGVYVHWPFCLAKCPYCDFNSHVRAAGVDQSRYVKAFEREIAHRAALAPGRAVQSIFFGGGTPSLMQPETVGAIIAAIGKAWTLSPDAEITLEANPTSVEAGRFKGYRAAGVNRVSLGVQSLIDADLKALGRMHSAKEALKAVAVARENFPRYSFDLIYARPGQSVKAWEAELSQAIREAGDHLSLYQLTIEPDTAFEKLHRAGKLKIPDDILGREFWDATQAITSEAGLPRYEISNHARPGSESRHNLVYWRYGEYAGVGPGAHGRLVIGGRRQAQSAVKAPEAWLEQVEETGSGLIEDLRLSGEESADEFLMMGLRLTEGINPRRYEDYSGAPLSKERIASLSSEGMIEETAAGALRVTAQGFPLLDCIVADLAA